MPSVTKRPSVDTTQRRRLRWVIAVLIAGCAQGLSAKPQEQGELTRFTYSEYHMGIAARLVVYAATRQKAETACEAAFKRIAELEAVMSDYRKDSELMRLCDRAGKGLVPVSEDLFRVLQRSQRVADQSGGAFDITVGPFVQLWRKARRDARLPSEEDLAMARKLVGWKMLRLDPRARAAQLETPGMRLDLGGIGKGFASDEAIKVLRYHGIKSALVEMGGDIVVSQAPPRATGWRISVPNAASRGKAAEMLLKDCAISSSGDTEQYVLIDGVRYSHVVDPKTGRALTRRVQATVIDRMGLIADPISTALTVVNERHRKELLRHYPGMKTFIKVARDP